MTFTPYGIEVDSIYFHKHELINLDFNQVRDLINKCETITDLRLLKTYFYDSCICHNISSYIEDLILDIKQNKNKGY